MDHFKKCSISALLALSLLGLIASQSAFAVCVDAECGMLEAACPGCHGVIVNGIQVAGSGGRTCTQRSVSAWLTTLNKMKNKGCNVVAGTEQVIAEYLACVGNPACTTSTTSSTTSTTLGVTLTCYGSGTIFTTTASTCPSGSSSTLPKCSPLNLIIVGNTWFCEGTTTTSSTSTSTTSTSTTGTNHIWCINQNGQFYPEPSGMCPTNICYYADGTSTSSTYGGRCPTGTNYFPPPTCSEGLPVLNGITWTCPTTSSTTSTSSTSTTDTTTSTTLCNTYVNGTTQYPYSGSGSCHSFANDDVTGLHIVRDQSYCKKHMSHLNSKGNHVHAYPHPMCM